MVKDPNLVYITMIKGGQHRLIRRNTLAECIEKFKVSGYDFFADENDNLFKLMPDKSVEFIRKYRRI